MKPAADPHVAVYVDTDHLIGGGAMVSRLFLGLLLLMPGSLSVSAQPVEQFEDWPILMSTFPSTGGGGIMIKGYDPVIVGAKCMTTFMAVTSDAAPAVYPSYVEFDAVASQGGTLCQNGRWRSFEGDNSGTTPFRIFFKGGVFRGSP